MRTTVSIDDHLLEAARAMALRTRRSLGDVVDDALRLLLVERLDLRPVRLTTYGGSGLRPGVDLEDRDAIATILDEDRDRHAAG